MKQIRTLHRVGTASGSLASACQYLTQAEILTLCDDPSLAAFVAQHALRLVVRGADDHLIIAATMDDALYTVYLLTVGVGYSTLSAR